MPYFITKIELRSRVHAATLEAAMEIAREVAKTIAIGDVGHLSDHGIDETEAVSALRAADQEDD